MDHKTNETKKKSYAPLPMGDKPMPHTPEMERAVLSCVLQEPTDTLDTVLSTLDTDASMYIPQNRLLLSSLREMARKQHPAQIDFVAVVDYLQDNGNLDGINGIEGLRDILNSVPSIANLENYLKLVKEKHLLRKLIALGSNVVGKCYEQDDDISQIVDFVEQETMKTTQLSNDTDATSLQKGLQNAVKYLEKLSRKDADTMGLRTGYSQLDHLITGLKGGEMFVLAARPSIGKTTFAMNLLRNVAVINKKPVAFFSLEMDATQVVTRMLCSEAMVDGRKVRDGSLTKGEWSKVLDASGFLNNYDLFIEDTPGMSSMDIRRKARRLKQKHDIQCIAIDYLQLMKAPSDMNKNSTRENEVARMSSDIKSLAREPNIPIVILAQLNRAAEGAGQPKISNLRESGAIEQDADVVALLHRERETDNDEARQAVAQGLGIETKLVIAKNRNGATDIVDLVFHPQYTRFDQAARVKDEDVPN